MEEQNCDKCTLRAKYDAKPKSFAGRFWRWHIKFCPGWKKFMAEIDEEKRQQLIEQYNIKLKA